MRAPLHSFVSGWLRSAPVALALLLAACSTSPPQVEGPAYRRGPIDFSKIPDAVPRAEPFSRRGNPPYYDQDGRRYYVMKSFAGYHEQGIASWYGDKFHGKETSSGDPFDMYQMTAAHKTLPIPCYAQVTDLKSGRSIVVRVNDRGPFVDNRIIDLSYVAAGKLGILNAGTAFVEVRAIDPNAPATRYAAAPLPRAAPAGGGAGVYLQVGAFSSRDNAERLLARLDSSSLPQATIREIDRLYRVRIGPLSDVDEADRVVGMLARLGISDSHIVRD